MHGWDRREMGWLLPFTEAQVTPKHIITSLQITTLVIFWLKTLILIGIYAAILPFNRSLLPPATTLAYCRVLHGSYSPYIKLQYNPSKKTAEDLLSFYSLKTEKGK